MGQYGFEWGNMASMGVAIRQRVDNLTVCRMVSGAKWGNMASRGVAKCRVDCRGVAVFGLFGLRQSATQEGVEGAGRRGGRVALILYVVRVG